MPTPEGMARTAAARAATREAFAERAARDPQKLARAVAVVRAAVGQELLLVDDLVALVDAS